MSEKQSNPNTLTLTGVEYQCYKAGQHFGMWSALNDGAINIHELNRLLLPQLATLAEATMKALPPDHKLQPTLRELPKMIAPLESLGKAFAEKGRQHQTSAQERTHELQKRGVGLPWWRSRAFISIVGFICAVVLATSISVCLVLRIIR